MSILEPGLSSQAIHIDIYAYMGVGGATRAVGLLKPIPIFESERVIALILIGLNRFLKKSSRAVKSHFSGSFRRL